MKVLILKEERNLLDAYAEHLGKIMMRYDLARNARLFSDILERLNAAPDTTIPYGEILHLIHLAFGFEAIGVCAGDNEGCRDVKIAVRTGEYVEAQRVICSMNCWADVCGRSDDKADSARMREIVVGLRADLVQGFSTESEQKVAQWWPRSATRGVRASITTRRASLSYRFAAAEQVSGLFCSASKWCCFSRE